MRLEIEYPVILQAIPPRSTLSKTVIVKDVLVADIQEYSASEAPVALLRKGVNPDTNMHWVQEYLHPGEGLFVAGKPPKIEDGRVRYAFGYEKTQVVSPIFHSEMHAKVQKTIKDIYCEHKSNAYKHVYNDDVYKAYIERWERFRSGEQSSKIPLFSEIKLSNLEEGGVERARDEINRKVADVILVDGRFYLRQPEPTYLANASVNARDPLVLPQSKLSEMEMLEVEKVDLSMAYFAADDLDGALAYAAEMWRIRKCDDIDYNASLSGDAFEVVDPSALKFDGERVSVLRSAKAIMRNFMSSIAPPAVGSASHIMQALTTNFENTGLEALVNYKHLEVALKSQETSTDDVCALIRDCISGSEGDRFAKGFEASMLEMALKRWERREVRKSFGLMF
jgi:hypothetical protein